MSYYYVTHPNLDLSATVSAPTTDKARTTFLDFMERTGRASRKVRQQLRRNLVAERISAPEEVNADVHLKYNYVDGEELGGERIQVAYAPPEEEELEEGEFELGGEEPEEEEGEEEGEEVEEIEGETEEVGASMSPIARLSLGED